MKKQTPVQWLYDQIGDTAPYEYAAQIASYLEEAMKMEEEQSKIPELSNKVSVKCEGNVDLPNMTNYPFIPELSDDEIEKAATAYSSVNSINKLELKDKYNDFIYAAKWYREQLKQRQ